jgi:WD40 repeat protein
LRWLSVLIVLAGGTFALVAMLSGFQDWSHIRDDRPDRDRQIAAAQQLGPVRQVGVPAGPEADHGGTLVPNCTLMNVEQQEVPAEKEGKVLFVGTDVKKGEDIPARRLVTPEPWFGFLLLRAEASEPGAFPYPAGSDTYYRPWHHRDMPEPNRYLVAGEFRRVRKLQVGDWVKAGDLVAMVDPTVAYSEMVVAHADLDGARAKWMAAVKAKKTTGERWENYRSVGGTAFSKDDYLKAKMEAENAVEEEKVQAAAIRSAMAKLSKAATTLLLHEVRATSSGVIKTIYKQPGEAVKPLDAILLIQNPKRLWCEGFLEEQEARALREGMAAEVDAARPEAPRAVLGGHRGPVTCVAVTAGDTPVIISGAEDLTLRGWDATTGRQRWELELVSVARSLVCTPKGGSNHLYFGDDAGVIRMLDLADAKAVPQPLAERHEGAVNSIALSPDGALLASGSTDKALCLWDAHTGDLLRRVPKAHRHEVTAVQFADRNHVVTAGRDGVLVVWEIDGKSVVKQQSIEDRTAEVTLPGVSPDGKQVLFDQGRELRLLSLDGKRIEGRLVNPSDALNFSGFAIFSPDGQVILTNGAAPGRLQLWRTPTRDVRASELRQFIWNGGAATCAAFAPSTAFLVTGTRDHQVLLWNVPASTDVGRRLPATLVLVEKSRDTRSRQVRVRAELENTAGLLAGAPATLVVPADRRTP